VERYLLHKRIGFTIIVGAKPRTSCRSLFKKLEILPLSYQYIFSLMNFFGNNQEYFKTNLSVHTINTRIEHYLHRPTANLSCFQKSTFYAGINIFSSLLVNLMSLRSKEAQFKVSLRRCLNTPSFYSVDEFFMF
jgi:hypothetical protein